MATSAQVRDEILAGKGDETLGALYGGGAAELRRQRARYAAALEQFELYFGPGRQVRLYSAPGRTELGGNHTDHQHGYGLAAAVTLEQFGPARQAAGAYQVKVYDSSVIRQPSCGQVDLSYFSDAALLGDSLTVGFSDYSINLGGALICGYTGVGPDAIVNRSAVKSSVRGSEVAMDVLTAAQPKKLYILLGTNTLTTLGAADRFLAYYGQMLDQLRQALPGCVIYVQSIPPVRPQAAAEKPGLASDVLRSVNEQLAKLAADKGCVYLDLWETFADENGNLKEMLAAPDGVHFSAGNGYGAWVTYLRNHAKYSASNSWTMGSAYSAE